MNTQQQIEKIAHASIKHYDFDIKTLSLLGKYTNTLFLVETHNSQQYVLRVCTPGWRTKTDIQSEIMWLQALARDTDLGAPVPIAARDGKTLLETTLPDIETTYHCMLMTWLPGTLLADNLTETTLYQMGALFARLHQHGAQFVPPQGFTTRKMDNIYARNEADVLFDTAQRDAFSDNAWAIYQKIKQQVTETFADLYRDATGLQVIHNDLHHENIMVDGDKLRPFDFEDTIWGFAVQDIAMALQDLMLDVQPDIFINLQAAFQRGYESLRPWPACHPTQIDTLRVGRMLWVANYVARYHRQHLQEHINRMLKPFSRFLDTGTLRLG